MVRDKIPNIFVLYLLVDLILSQQTKSLSRTVSFHEGKQLQRVCFCLQKNRSSFELLSSTLIKKKALLSPLKAFSASSSSQLDLQHSLTPPKPGCFSRSLHQKLNIRQRIGTTQKLSLS